MEQWLDDLHMKRQYLEVSWQSRKTQLEQCLALAMLARDLRELEDTVADRRNILANTDHLGKASGVKNFRSNKIVKSILISFSI